MVGRASMGPILDSCCIGTTQKLLLIISPASGLWQMPSLQDTVEASCTGGSREYQLREPQLNRREDLVDQGNACFPRRVFCWPYQIFTCRLFSSWEFFSGTLERGQVEGSIKMEKAQAVGSLGHYVPTTDGLGLVFLVFLFILGTQYLNVLSNPTRPVKLQLP